MEDSAILYQIIGELFVARARTEQVYQNLLKQVDEMAELITELRQKLGTQDGQLAKPDDNNTV